MTLPPTLAHGVQQCQEWLKELRDNGDLTDTTEAFAVLRAVLQELRDRLTLEEAVDLGGQLPLILRGVYYEGWKPHTVRHKVDTIADFAGGVATRMRPRRVPAERAIRDVFSILAHHCDPGEISDVIAQLPAELKTLWPETAQTFRQRTKM